MALGSAINQNNNVERRLAGNTSAYLSFHIIISLSSNDEVQM